MSNVIEIRRCDSELAEKMARFAHEGLPYMASGDNWVDYDNSWVINIWWDHTEQVYRATAYKKEGATPDIRSGIDLF